MEGALCCSICGDAIGSYESLIVLEGDTARITSLAREPHLGAHNETLVHRVCGPRLGERVVGSLAEPPAAQL